MLRHYILEGHKAVLLDDLLGWARWFETAELHVAHTQVTPNIRVSTVFLGVDHNFAGLGCPIIFETMVFGGPLDGEQERYSTWEEAESGHEAMLKRVNEYRQPISEIKL